MSRYTRGREPYAPKVDRVELPEGHVKLRAILFGAAILLAVIAFGVGLNSLLMPGPLPCRKLVRCPGLSSGYLG